MKPAPSVLIVLALILAGCGSASPRSTTLYGVDVLTGPASATTVKIHAARPVHATNGRYTVRQVETVFQELGYAAPTVRRFHGEVALLYSLVGVGPKNSWLWALIHPRTPTATFQPAYRYHVANRRNVWLYYSPRPRAPVQAQVKSLLNAFK